MQIDLYRSTPDLKTFNGDAATTFCRNLVLNGRWEDAIRLFLSCFPYLGSDIAYGVLRGEIKLTGEAGKIAFSAEDAVIKTRYNNEFITKFRGIYGVVNHGMAHYQPYAFVSSWGGYDLYHFERNHRHPEYEVDIKNSFDPKNIDDFIYRSIHYCDDKVNDIVEILDFYTEEKKCILFKKIPVPPPWSPKFYHPQIALKNYLFHGDNLEERGFKQTTKNICSTIINPKIDESLKRDFNLLADSGWLLKNGYFFALTENYKDIARKIMAEIYRKRESINPIVDLTARRAVLIGYPNPKNINVEPLYENQEKALKKWLEIHKIAPQDINLCVSRTP